MKRFPPCLPAFAVSILLGAGAAHAALTLNFDIDKAGSAVTYSGVGVAPDAGTVWNSVPVPQSVAGNVTVANAYDSAGGASGITLVIDRNSGEQMKVYDDTSAGSPNPSALMRDYTYWGGWNVALSNLPVGTYDLYIFGHGNNLGDVNTFTLDASNGGATDGTTDDLANYRDILQAGAEGNTYAKLTGVVGVAGTLSFSGFDNLNGFQIVQINDVPEPGVALLGCLGVLGLLRRRR